MGIANRERHAGGFEREVQPLRSVGIEGGQIEMLEDIEEYERHQPLSVRRQFHHIEPAIIRCDRGDRFAAVLCEILARQPGSTRRKRRHDIGRSILVKRLGSSRGDRFQGFGQRRKPQDIAGCRCAAVGQIMPRCSGIGAQCRLNKCPIIGDARRHRKPLLGIADRRGEGMIEPEPAVGLQHRLPRFDRARNRDAMGRVEADAADALLPQHIGARGRGGAAGAVIAPDRHARFGDEAKTIAADAGHMRLDDGKNSSRRHGRICRRATRLQRGDGRLACKRVRCRRHTLAGKYRRTAGTMEISHTYTDRRAGKYSPTALGSRSALRLDLCFRLQDLAAAIHAGLQIDVVGTA